MEFKIASIKTELSDYVVVREEDEYFMYAQEQEDGSVKWIYDELNATGFALDLRAKDFIKRKCLTECRAMKRTIIATVEEVQTEENGRK